MNPNFFISPSDIADLANVSLPTVSNWVRRFDDFPAGQVLEGSSRLRYNKDEILAWLEVRKLLRVESRNRAALLSIDRKSQRDFFGSLFVTLHFVPKNDKASLSVVIEKYKKLAQESSNLLVNFDLTLAVDVVAQVLPEYSSLSNAELAQILAETDRGSLGRIAGEHSTPESLFRFLAALAKPDTTTVVDLASGEGRLLEHFASIGVGQLHRGSDIDEQSVIRARQSALLRGLDIQYSVRNVMSSTRGEAVSLVVVDPPLNTKTAFEDMSAATWPYGPPSPQDITTAFLQRAASLLAPNGQALILSSASLLTRGGKVSRLRWELLQAGVIRGIVALPSRLRTDTARPLALWILGAADPSIDEIVMVDASLSSPAELAADGPVVEATIAELAGDSSAKDPSYATTVPKNLLLTRDVELRPNAWVARKRDIVEPEEQLRLATQGLKSIQVVSGRLPLVGSDLRVRGVEPRLVSLEQLRDDFSIQLFTNLRANAAADGPGDLVLDSRILLGTRDKNSAPRSVKPPGTGKRIEPGDVVVAAGSRSVFATVWHETGWIAGNGTNIIRVRDGRMNPEFLSAAIVNPRNHVHLDAGAQKVQLNVAALEVPEISLIEQDELAVLLTALHESQRGLEQQLATLSQRRKDIVDAIGSGTLTTLGGK